ncbi:MAG: hypothetical protein EPO21_22100 [Chloroflexota bacterium]|nr:MAG: hypothetical protein EPO21_22100 [Chloroflexota bacterium]
MRIIESWEDEKGRIYAIVEHSKDTQARYAQKPVEVVFMQPDGELASFGGTVGYTIADFNTREEAQDFLLRGIAGQDEDPEIWLKMIRV